MLPLLLALPLMFGAWGWNALVHGTDEKAVYSKSFGLLDQKFYSERPNGFTQSDQKFSRFDQTFLLKVTKRLVVLTKQFYSGRPKILVASTKQFYSKWLKD